MLSKNLAIIFFCTIACSNLLAETFDVFKAKWDDRAAAHYEKTAAEKNNFLSFILAYKRGLSIATALPPETKIVKKLESEPGVALTNPEIEDRINYINEKVENLASEWGIAIPESPRQRELGTL